MINDHDPIEEEYVSGEDYREQLEELQPNSTQRTFGWRQKLAVVFLALFGVSAVILWGVQFNNSLNGQQPAAAPPAQQTRTAGDSSEEARLRAQDTDEDGLSDYEELQFYKTSPYIQDTDSDGVNDFEELQQGEDPNCPQGKRCDGNTGGTEAAAPAQPTGTTPQPSAASPDFSAPSGAASQSGDDPFAEDTITGVLAGEGDAETLRTLLREAGMGDEVLDGISDEQLLETYRSVLENQDFSNVTGAQ